MVTVALPGTVAFADFAGVSLGEFVARVTSVIKWGIWPFVTREFTARAVAIVLAKKSSIGLWFLNNIIFIFRRLSFYCFLASGHREPNCQSLTETSNTTGKDTGTKENFIGYKFTKERRFVCKWVFLLFSNCWYY